MTDSLSRIPRWGSAALLAVGLTSPAWAEEPVLNDWVGPDVYAVHVDKNEDGTPVMRWAVSGEYLYRAGAARVSISSLCAPREDLESRTKMAGPTLVVQCQDMSYGPVVESVVLSGDREPWSRPFGLVPESGGRVIAEDGSQLLDPDGSVVWKRGRGNRVAQHVLPSGGGAAAFGTHDGVLLESFGAAGQARWTAKLPMQLTANDRFRGGPASIKTIDVDVVAGPAGQVAVAWSQFRFENGDSWGRVMLYSDTGEVLISRSTSFTPGSLRYLPDQDLLLFADRVGMTVLDLRDGVAHSHPITVGFGTFSPDGEHLLVRTPDHLMVLATPTLREPSTWVPVLELSAPKGVRLTLDTGRLSVVGQGRVKVWDLPAAPVAKMDDPQQAE